MEIISSEKTGEILALSKSTMPYLNYINLMYEKFSTSAFMRVGAERGDLWD